MNKINWKISMLCFWIAYFVVTVIGVGHIVFNGTVLRMETMANISQEQQEGMINTAYGMGIAYAKTVPFHPLYNIVVWPIFAFVYFCKTKPNKKQWKTALLLGLNWLIITMVFDLFGWVIIKHPWSMTWKAFYVDYQPWITLIYIEILVSAFIGMAIYNRKKEQ